MKCTLVIECSIILKYYIISNSMNLSWYIFSWVFKLFSVWDYYTLCYQKYPFMYLLLYICMDVFILANIIRYVFSGSEDMHLLIFLKYFIKYHIFCYWGAIFLYVVNTGPLEGTNYCLNGIFQISKYFNTGGLDFITFLWFYYLFMINFFPIQKILAYHNVTKIVPYIFL